MTPADQAQQDAEKDPPPEKTAGEEKPAPKAPKKPLPVWVPFAAIVLFLVLTLSVGYVVWLVVNTLHLVDDFGRLPSGRVVEKQRYEDALGWGSELMVDKKSGKPARIRFLLHDAARKPVTDAVVEIMMNPSESPPQTDPPTPPAKPGRARLKMDEPGVYRGEVEMEGSGRWEARILVTQGKNAYQVTKRILVP